MKSTAKKSRINVYKKQTTPSQEVIQTMQNKGIGAGLVLLIRKGVDLLLLHLTRCGVVVREKNFIYQGKRLSYCKDPYNLSTLNERAFEVPVAFHFINAFKGKRIAEVGAVMKHYTPCHWDVYDKFETGKDILNADAVTFKPKGKYDFILSISTLEHIGFDDSRFDETLPLVAVQNITSWLKKGGLFLFTVPIGYNKSLDRMLFTHTIQTHQLEYFKRDWKNQWFPVSERMAQSAGYGWPYNNANVVAVGLIRK